METKKIFYYFLLLSVLNMNCIEEYEPSRQGYENLLVVEAFLSGDSSPFEVLLSRSVPIDTTQFVPEQSAEVRLSSATGKTYNLYEKQPGTYTTTSPVTGIIGESYQLAIQTRDGKQYASDPVTMRGTPPIDSIHFIYEKRPWAGVNGIQIYVNAHDTQGKTQYYRWEWDETWVIRTPFDSNIIWEDGRIVPRNENINTCWIDGTSTSIDIFSTKALSEDRVRSFPLLFVSNRTSRLRERYSLNVKQYSLSEESYNYWIELQKSTENLGTLFDPQPSTLRGNLHNVNDDKEIVIGYFDASLVSEERIFIARSDIPGTEFPNQFPNCFDSTVQFDMIPNMMQYGYILVREEFMIGYVMAQPPCIDCTLYGDNEKPDFW